MSTRKISLTENNEQEALRWLLRYSPLALSESHVVASTLENLVEQSAITMASTRTSLHTMAELNDLRAREHLSDTQWRQVGNNQKTLYRDRLLRRVGHAPATSTVPAFEFNDTDWQNIFQLEALVEFYMNFTDPWLLCTPLTPGVNLPRPPAGTGYITVNLIIGWHLVVVDTFGGRLNGNAATTAGYVVTLDGLPNPSKINPGFDTIYLPNDTARPSKTYRITDVDDARRRVVLDGRPELTPAASRWHIPAGVSGQLPAVAYNLGPGNTHGRGFDHFDGAMFIVKDGTVHRQFRWNSYTSRNYAPGEQYLSSIRGNKQYDFSSFRSGRNGSFRNYCFKVNDRGAAYDGVREARFYFRSPVTEDTAPAGVNPETDPEQRGKSLIRIHYSETNSTGGCNSAGCIVSGDFYAFRDQMIDLYQTGYAAAHHGTRDAAIDRLQGVGHDGSRRIWCRTQAASGAPQDPRCPAGLGPGPIVTAGDWNNRLNGSFWLVRPDERPLG